MTRPPFWTTVGPAYELPALVRVTVAASRNRLELADAPATVPLTTNWPPVSFRTRPSAVSAPLRLSTAPPLLAMTPTLPWLPPTVTSLGSVVGVAAVYSNVPVVDPAPRV